MGKIPKFSGYNKPWLSEKTPIAQLNGRINVSFISRDDLANTRLKQISLIFS